MEKISNEIEIDRRYSLLVCLEIIFFSIKISYTVTSLRRLISFAESLNYFFVIIRLLFTSRALKPLIQLLVDNVRLLQ